MSENTARKYIQAKIDAVLAEYTRGLLDQKTHVIDITYGSLLKSNNQRDTPEFRKNYEEFLATASSLAFQVRDFAEALAKLPRIRKKDACIMREGTSILLISKSFENARLFITEVSHKIPDNEDFGATFRTRNYEDVQLSARLSSVKNRYFLQGNTVKQVSPIKPGSKKHALLPVKGFSNIKEVYYAESIADQKAGILKKAPASQYDNIEVNIAVDKQTKEKIVTVRQRGLSVLDLGHGQGYNVAQTTPLAQKFKSILAINELSSNPAARRIIGRHMLELAKLHNIVDFEFKNTSNDVDASAYVVISIQKFTRNNLLSKKEGELLRILRKELELILPGVPGSNTLIEDKAEIIKNRFISILTKKPVKPIKKHKLVKGKSTTKSNKDIVTSKAVKAKRKVQVIKDVNPSLQQISLKSDSKVDLNSLLNTINMQITQRIRQNMGTGYNRDILNYRTGRFANSVKVERLSESRAGMITAFYSYMKNPYATFSAGGRQENPRSRDPKTLISKSIREIAATLVTNRLRAVST